MTTGKKDFFCLEESNNPVADRYISFQPIYSSCLEDDNMINIEATIRWKGYNPNDLKKGSHKRVWANCDVCGKGRWISLGDYSAMCYPCATIKLCRGRILSEETKRKISEGNKGKQNCLGRILSEETKRKIGESNRGKASRFKGTKGLVTRSEETKRKISEIKKGTLPWNTGKHHSEETKKKIGIKSVGRKANWQGGISFIPYCHKFNERLKEKIRNRDDRTCQLCGAKENGRKLDVHHIHYDKPNCDPDLIALCNRCNAKVNSNRNYYEDVFMQSLKDRGII